MHGLKDALLNLLLTNQASKQQASNQTNKKLELFLPNIELPIMKYRLKFLDDYYFRELYKLRKQWHLFYILYTYMQYI